jgi:hypothetical protein
MQVIYVPNPQSSGLDTFSYSANDCPVNVQVWILFFMRVWPPSHISRNLIASLVVYALQCLRSLE